jgi:hypothetical protein
MRALTRSAAVLVVLVGLLGVEVPPSARADGAEGPWSVNIPVSSTHQRATCGGGIEVRHEQTIYSVTLGPDVQAVFHADPVFDAWQTLRPLTRAESRRLLCALPHELAHTHARLRAVQRKVRRLRAIIASQRRTHGTGPATR